MVEPVVTEKFGQLNSVARQKEEIEELTENYPNWNEVIGAPGSTTEYRKWLLEQPAGYQTVVTNSWKANTIGRSLEKFHAHQEAQAGKKKKSAPTLSREEVLKEAIAQRGNPGHESGTTGDDDFNAGFNGKK